MSSSSKTAKYPISMSIVIIGLSALLVALLLDLVLRGSMVAGLLGLWGLIIAGIGLVAATIVWLLGKLE